MTTKPGRHVWRKRGQRKSRKARTSMEREREGTRRAGRGGKEERRRQRVNNRGKKDFIVDGLIPAACLIQYKQTSR